MAAGAGGRARLDRAPGRSETGRGRSVRMPRWCLPTSCRPRLPNSWAHLPDETQGEAGTGIGHTAHLVAVGRSTVELRAFGVLAVPCAMCHVAVSGPAADKRRSVRDCQRATGWFCTTCSKYLHCCNLSVLGSWIQYRSLAQCW